MLVSVPLAALSVHNYYPGEAFFPLFCLLGKVKKATSHEAYLWGGLEMVSVIILIF